MPDEMFDDDYRGIRHTLSTAELERRGRPFARLEAFIYVLLAMLLLNLVAQVVGIVQNEQALRQTTVNRCLIAASLDPAKQVRVMDAMEISCPHISGE